MFAQYAAEAGTEAAAMVAAGTRSVDWAGDQWLAYADNSHELGEAFIRAYDAAGGVR